MLVVTNNFTVAYLWTGVKHDKLTNWTFNLSKHIFMFEWHIEYSSDWSWEYQAILDYKNCIYVSSIFLFYRDFVGPVISGAVINKTNFGWTMTVYFFTTIAVVISILLLQLYKYVKRQQQSSSIAMPHKLNYGSLNDEDYLLSTLDKSD